SQRQAAAWPRRGDNLARHVVGRSTPPLGDNQRRIYCGVERRRVGEILQFHDARLLDEKTSNSAASERLPELHRYEQREHGPWPQQTYRALDEERREINLCGEPAARLSACRATLPSAGAKYPKAGA